MEDLDTFDSNTVIESTPVDDSQMEGGEGLDTFDSPKVEEVEKEEEKVSTDSQVNLLDDQEDKNAESKSDKKDEKEKSDEEGADGEKKAEDAGKKEEKEEVGEEKPKAEKRKEIKGKLGEDEFGIPTEAEVAVRIKGKKENVTVQELINNYSGKVAYDQEFSKLGEQKKEVEVKSEQLEGEVGYLREQISGLMSILDNKDANPMDALEYLLDTTGRDTVLFKKRVMETMLEEVESLQEMDDVERELYWKDQELTNLKKRQESSMASSRQEQEETQLRDKVDTLREAQNVSEDNFVDAHTELESMGYENITPEQVVEYAALKPHFDIAEGLVSEYSEQMDKESIGNLISDMAVDLKSGTLTKEAIKEILEEEFGDYKELESLTKKSAKAKAAETKKTLKYRDRGENHTESFEDFDNYYAS